MVRINDWKKLAESFRKHFRSSETSIKDERLVFQDSSATLEITKDGKAVAEMPLHSFNTDNVERVSFSDESVELNGEEFNYRFRK